LPKLRHIRHCELKSVVVFAVVNDKNKKGKEREDREEKGRESKGTKSHITVVTFVEKPSIN